MISLRLHGSWKLGEAWTRCRLTRFPSAASTRDARKQARLVDGGTEWKLERRRDIVSAVSPSREGRWDSSGATGSEFGELVFQLHNSKFILQTLLVRCILYLFASPYGDAYGRLRSCAPISMYRSQSSFAQSDVQCGDSTASLQSWTVGFTKYAYSGAFMLRGPLYRIKDRQAGDRSGSGSAKCTPLGSRISSDALAFQSEFEMSRISRGAAGKEAQRVLWGVQAVYWYRSRGARCKAS